jgi:hypothetical protein
LAAWIAGFALPTLAGRLGGLLSEAHVEAVVAGARAGDPRLQRRVFALEMIARGLVG